MLCGGLTSEQLDPTNLLRQLARLLGLPAKAVTAAIVLLTRSTPGLHAAFGKAVRSKREILAALSAQLDRMAAEGPEGAEGPGEAGTGCLLAKLVAGLDHEGKPLSRQAVLVRLTD